MIFKRTNIKELYDLIERLKTKVFDVSIQYKFLVLLKKTNEELDLLNEQILLLAEEFGMRDENNQLIYENNIIKINPQKKIECAKKVSSIYNVNVTYPDIYFTFDELIPLGLNLGELALLEPFIKN